MKTLIYKKINQNFTFENLSLYLTKFWLKEVYSARKAGYSKIWLTIIVNTNYNRSFVLIKNLPFNTKNYRDVILVLKQNIYSSFFKDYRIKNIIFKFNYCDFTLSPLGQLKNKVQRLNFLILIIILFLYFFDLTLLQNIEHVDTSFNLLEEKVNMENITCYGEANTSNSVNFTKNKGSIFNEFIKLFHSDLSIGSPNTTGKCISSSIFIVDNGMYPANSFLQVRIGSNTASNSFCLGEYIVYHEFYKVFILQDYLEAIKEFSSTHR